MALGKIIQTLLRSAGGKKAAAKMYKQARKEIPHKSPGIPGVQTGKSYRGQWAKTHIPYTGKRFSPSEIMMLERKYGAAPPVRLSGPRGEWLRQKARQEGRSIGRETGPISSLQYFNKAGKYKVPKYYERFPKKMTRRMWQESKDLEGLKYPGGYPEMNRMKDFIRRGYSSGRPWDAMARKLPKPASVEPLSPEVLRKLRRLHSPFGVERSVKPLSSEIVRKIRKAMGGRRQLSPQMVRGEYPKPSFASRPMETAGRRGETLERIMRMRRDPGMARGLGRMEARKASALNTPGTPLEGRALRYEPSIARAANFNSLIVKDKGFRTFLKDVVGEKRVMNLPPKMRDRLAKRYLSLKRRGISEAEASYKAVMGKGSKWAEETGGHPAWGTPGVDF